MFAFDLGPVRGKHVLNATYAATLYHSWACSDTPVELWFTSGIDDNSSWNSTGFWTNLDTRWGHAGSCGAPAQRLEFRGGLAGQVQNGANAGWPTITVGLKAPNEGDVNQWKRFYADATLSVDYNSYPYTPDGLDTQGKGCVTGAGRPYLATTTPTLKAHVGDPDAGQMLNVDFSWGPVGSGLSGGIWQNNVGNGATAVQAIPAGQLQDGGTYYWQSYASDGIDNSGWSAACEFTVDVTPPNPPKAVLSPDYPADGAFHGTVGRTGRFTLVPPDSHPEDVAAFLVGLNQNNQASTTAAIPVNTAVDYGNMNLDAYCRARGYDGGASLDGTTAYDWHCVNAGVRYSMNLVDTCGWQFGTDTGGGNWSPRYRDRELT